MRVPTAFELVHGVHFRAPRTARGIYRDRRPSQDVHRRFVHEHPDRWVWLHVEDPPAGLITDGRTHTIIDEGVAILVTTEGYVGPTHRIGNLLDPRQVRFGSAFGEIAPGIAIGREAWITTTEGKSHDPEIEIAFDCATGILLYLRSGEMYWGFESLTLNEDCDAEEFVWSGPTTSKTHGTAVVTRDPETNTFSAYWAVTVRGHNECQLNAPEGMTFDEAWAWGEERAEEIVVRPGSEPS